MTTFGPFNEPTPCAGPIDEAYAQGLNAYVKEIDYLKNEIQNVQHQTIVQKEEIKRVKKIEEEAISINKNARDELNITERVNHHLDCQIKAIQRYKNSLTSCSTQTYNNELMIARKENKDLLNQVQELLTMTNQSVNTQNVLLQKIQNKKQKIQNVKSQLNDLSKTYDDLVQTEMNLSNKINDANIMREQYKAENMRISLRITEAEGNIEESELNNSKLREICEQMRYKQQAYSPPLIFNNA